MKIFFCQRRIFRNSEFDKLEGYELRFGEREQSFLVGYNRFKNNEEMYGWIEMVGNPAKSHNYGE